MIYRNLKKTVFCFIVLSITFSLSALANPWDPDNYDKVLVFIADSPIESVDGSLVVDGLVPGDGMGFFKGVLGWSDEEIEADRQSAITFFQERFGLSIDDPRLYFSGYEINPEANYRVAAKSGKDKVPSEGITVLDGGWALVVFDPSGVDLGGEFAGVHVPGGSMFIQGNYVLRRPHEEDVILDIQSRSPMQPVGTGMVIDCEIFHPTLGRGVGWGFLESPRLPDDRLMPRVHMVATFPGFGFIDEELTGD